MPYKDESKLVMTGGDAAADTSTQLSFNPSEGPFGPDNVVTGTIGAGDEDWIAIKLTEGNTYTITVGGDTAEGRLNDSVLKLMDSKGRPIDMNDDSDPAKGELGSKLTFTPEAGSGTQVYFISVSGYMGNPGADSTGDYTVSVMEMAVRPAGTGADIEATSNADHKLTGTDDSESIAGMGGNDTLIGLGGDDSLSGGAGNDLLVGGAGADMLKGGDGLMDTISYMGSPMGVTINLIDGTARGGDADDDDLGDDIEYVIGSDHDDMLTGTDDASNGNSLWGHSGNDTLSGRDGPDKLYGGGGDDVLDGGDEDDELEGGPGADQLTGGGGVDTASYASSMMGVTVRLHANQAMGGDAEGDVFVDMTTEEYTVPAEDPDDPDVVMEETVPDIVHLIGSNMADILAGDSRDNDIWGRGGDDKLYGGPGGGDDKLYGEGGNDMLFGGRGADVLSGGMGDDTLNGGAGDDKFYGDAGSDMLYADLSDDTLIYGGAGMDTLSFEKVTGDNGVGASGAAFTLGGAGVVANAAGNGYATVAADGTETPVTGIHAAGIETVIGTLETDFITGSNDVAEEIEGGDGRDTLDGGTGPGDTVSYASSDRRVRVDLGDGQTTDPATPATGSNSGGHANDILTGFENIKGSAYGDVLTARSNDTDGEAGNNIQLGSTLWGLGGDDTLVGKGGNDTLEGGAGRDELDGGRTQASAGDQSSEVNTLSYAGSDAGVTVNLANASASGGHAEGDDIDTYEYNDTKGTAATTDDEEIDVATFINVTGSMHGDNLTGDLFGNHLVGGAGDDSLRGGAGADILSGGPGADRLDGGSSTLAAEDDTNTADIDESTTQHEDWAAYRSAEDVGVTVNLNTGSGTAGDAMGDTLKNIELVWGSKQGDTFIAGAGADVIHGDGGSDTISYMASKHGVIVVLPTVDDAGSTNPQWTAAVAGPPLVPAMFNAATEAEVGNWRSGNLDALAERAPTWDAGSARPAASYEVQRDDSDSTTKSYAEGDILASIENVTGSRQDDTITGDGVPNVIKGGEGVDMLNGGGEADKLYGGAGNDTLGAADFNDNGTATTEDGDDMLDGGAGDDKLYGGAGSDTLIGGAGNDDLDGGLETDTTADTTATDTFVFAPGHGSDVITNFDTTVNGTATNIGADNLPNTDDDTLGTTSTGDKIDLSAFGIDKDDLADLISVRAGNTIINLEDYGGGRITIQGAVNAAGDSTITPTVFNDTNGDAAGLGVDGTEGMFIL